MKKIDYDTEVNKIKSDYVKNTELTSKLDNLETTRKIDDKASKISSDILGFEHRLKQKEDALNDLER